MSHEIIWVYSIPRDIKCTHLKWENNVSDINTECSQEEESKVRYCKAM